MNIDILTLFPKMFTGPFSESIIKRGQDQGILNIQIHDLRNWTEDKHKTVDTPPYGGGAGMVMRVDVIDRAVTTLIKNSEIKPKVILLDTKGKLFTQQHAKAFSTEKQLILIAGHYEGVDHRVHEYIADEVVSVGNYVLTGGELPAMVLVDAVARLLPGVLGNPESLTEESFSLAKEIEYPQFTRPEVYRGWKVPDVLMSGNHAQINQWRAEQKSDS